MSRTPELAIVLCLALSATPACFVRKRTIRSPVAQPSGALLTATKDELIERLHSISDPIRSFIMNVDLSPSVLDRSKGVATDYATVSAYILFQKPDDIRILARDPVIGSTIFDMVSNGKEFRVSIPPRKRFIVGNDNEPAPSGNKLENLRPEALLTSLLIYPPDATTDFSILENDTERGLYLLLIVHRNQDQFALAREVYFDGRTLQVSRQKTFDASGTVVSDTRYSDWKNYGDVSFPSQIDIQRPKNNYEVQLSVVNMKFNTSDVTAEKFVLEQPPGSQLEELK
jgi:Domain of unknown function (DUF4292)